MNISLLEQKIDARAKRRGLTVSFQKLAYATRAQFRPCAGRQFKRALFVGVGHGHDVIVALSLSHIVKVIGVDPYYGDDGNDNSDYEGLLSTIDEMKLADRFTVFKGTIQEYLVQHQDTDLFDLIILPDVLHHIFVEKRPLEETNSFGDAVDLFQDLKRVATGDCCLIINEVQRTGLRPWLHGLGIVKGNVDYSTKQGPSSWTKALIKAGWKRIEISTYVPWALRNTGPLFQNTIGRFTVSPRYALYFERDN